MPMKNASASFRDGDARRDFRQVDGEGDKLRFFRKMRSVTSVVFVETADYAIAVAGYEAVQFSFRTVEPFGYETVVVGIHSDFRPDVEVRVTVRLAVQSCLYPVIVHAECPEKYFPVVAAQETVNR